jgi:TRAP-type C4-dicarboxylate transport system permease small subunit
MLEKTTRYVVRVLEIFSCALLFLLGVTILVGIGDRFLTHLGFSWPEELARILFIWLGPITAAILVHRREHFDVPNVVDKIFTQGTKGRRIYEILISIAMAGLMVSLFLFGLSLVNFARFHRAASIPISMMYVYLSIPVGAVFMIFFYLVNAYSDIKRVNQLSASLTNAEK